MSTTEILSAQATEDFYRIMAATLEIPKLKFSYDREGLILSSSRIYGASKRLVPVSLRQILIRLSHFPLLAGLTGGKKMYDKMSRSLYWPHMAQDV